MTIFITLIILSITKNECDHDDTIWNKQSRFSSTYRLYYYINCDMFGYSHDDIRNNSNKYLSKYSNKEFRTMIIRKALNAINKYSFVFDNAPMHKLVY